MKLITWLRGRVRDDWRRASKAWSTWTAGLGVVVLGWAAWFPQLAADVWNAVPYDLRQHLPYADKFAWFLFIGIFVMRYLKQGKANG